jgi:hypothetical protein
VYASIGTHSTAYRRVYIEIGAPAASTAQHSTAQHSTAQHSTAQHSTAQHSMKGTQMKPYYIIQDIEDTRKYKGESISLAAKKMLKDRDILDITYCGNGYTAIIYYTSTCGKYVYDVKVFYDYYNHND